MGIYYTINFSADRSASAGNIAPGLCVCFTSDGTALTVATAAALGGRAVLGIVVRNPQSNLVTFQSVGACDRTITGIPFLSGATKMPIRVNATGHIERANPILAGDNIVGTCNEWGDALLSFADQTSAIVGALNGDVTGAVGDNRVTSIRGDVDTNTVVMSTNTKFVWPLPGGTLFNNGNKLEWRHGDGLYLHPTFNLACFLGAVNTTQAGIWYTTANASTPSNSNYTVLYDSTADALRLRASSVNVISDGLLVTPSSNEPIYMGSLDSVTGGIWVGSANTSAPTTGNYQVLFHLGNITLRGTTVGLDTNVLSFAATAVTPLISQEPIVGTPNPIAMMGQGSQTTDTAGGQAQIGGGWANGAAAHGGAYLAAGPFPLIEAADLYAGGHNYVTALNLSTPVTSTNMPAGSGSGVTFVANCSTIPTALVTPGSGAIFFSKSGALYMQGADGWQVAL